MSSSDLRRSAEAAEPVERRSMVEPADDARGFDPSATVVKAGSTSRRRVASAPAAISVSPIPMPRPGDMIDTFRLEEAIGVGGMGAVYRALDTRLDRHVALKLLPPDQAGDDEVVKRFYQEGRSAAQLDHENIARVFSIGQDGHFHYIAFEYIEGVTIRQRVEGAGPLPVGEAVDVALQIAGALVHASRRGVVHRDIKPSNIILTPQGRAKLVDMGLARRFERGGDHGLTQSGMTLGTFDYISPEQARDPRDVDVRSDLYSLGCTMFHMLTGRPPFPGGTVLQKLIQHREEAPADVRTLNSAVPVELAAIIAKLMAKERDRRYQGPEHLVRDLLGLAASLGLERPPSAAEPWLTVHPHPWWERHLVWLVPAAGFVAVIAWLAWWGRDSSRPGPADRPAAARPGAGAAGDLSLIGPADRDRSPVVASGEDTAAETGPSAGFPRTIPVSSHEDLLAVIAAAPPRSVIVLADDGPYRMGGRAVTSRPSTAPADADLTIKAESGIHPVLKPARDVAAADRRLEALLAFTGGHVAIEGLEFDFDEPASGEAPSAILCENTELTVRGCSFRRAASSASGSASDSGDASAIRVRAGRPRAGLFARPPQVLADRCHFDGGQAAVRSDGAAEVAMRDCTLGPAAPSFWFDAPRSALAQTGEVRLMNCSILAGNGPVFRVGAGPVRFRVDDCVIAPAGQAAAELLRADDPRQVSWLGRGNVYGSMSAYLATSSASQAQQAVTEFSAWEKGPAEIRELGSGVRPAPIWETADPLQALSRDRDDPTRAFALDPELAARLDVGAREGPFGSVIKKVRLVDRSPAGRSAAAAAGRVTTPARSGEGTDHSEASPPLALLDRPAALERVNSNPSDETALSPASQEPMDLAPMPPMPPVSPAGSLEADSSRLTASSTEPPPKAKAEPARSAAERTGATVPATDGVENRVSEEDVIRSAEQFVAMLRVLGKRGGTLRVAVGADIVLPSLVLESPASSPVRVIAEPGGARPRLRFGSSPASANTQADSAGLFDVRAGSLQIQGLDISISEPVSLPTERLAAVVLAPGTHLQIADCTVTVGFRRPSASALIVRSTAADIAAASASSSGDQPTVIEVRSSFIRSGGDTVAVAGGASLTLGFEDVLIAAEGSLIHATGVARPASGPPASPPSLGVRLDRVSARVKGGLAYLQTTADLPLMPVVDVRARSSILSTVGGDDPLFRLEGQDQIEDLRDRVRWEAHRVAYHRIKAYRRDEILQSGGFPRVYDRDDWTRAFRPTDDSPVLSEVGFRHQPDLSTPSWKIDRDDLEIADGEGAPPIGPAAGKVPAPPGDQSS